ncbi:transglutaminase domain-containing protein [Novipirellula artificiosorum]|nr:transglutaminase domain-containing protein [Novipirellula artificiosorum]
MAFCVGCDIPERAPLERPERASVSRTGQNNSTSGIGDEQTKQPKTTFMGEWQAWDAYYVGDEHVGYGHLTAKVEGDAPKQRVKFSFEDCLLVDRGKNGELTQRRLQSSSEELDGTLISYECELTVGPVVTRCTGMVEEDHFSVTKMRGNQRSAKKMDWDRDVRGLVAVEESLRRSPMNAEDERSFTMILPMQEKIGTVRMKCLGNSAVRSLDGTDHSLREISVQVDHGDGLRKYLVVWTSEEGEVLRAYNPELDLVTYRTDMRTATRGIAEAEESVALASVKMVNELDRADQTQRVGFKLVPLREPIDANASLVEPQPGQYVRSMDDGAWLVLVTRLDEAPKNGFVSAEFPVLDVDTTPNKIIDSRETMVRQIAQASSGTGQYDELELALELIGSINRMTQLNVTPTLFPRSSDVARNGQGDSTAYAVLLAGLLRTKGIPARVAFGYRYEEKSSPRLVYHAWTLGYVDGKWLPLDATTGGIAAADRITLATSNLSEANINQALVPILDFLGAYEVEVVPSAVRY